jgi:hypothetical protein
MCLRSSISSLSCLSTAEALLTLPILGLEEAPGDEVAEILPLVRTTADDERHREL